MAARMRSAPFETKGQIEEYDCRTNGRFTSRARCIKLSGCSLEERTCSMIKSFGRQACETAKILADSLSAIKAARKYDRSSEEDVSRRLPKHCNRPTYRVRKVPWRRTFPDLRSLP